LSKEVREIGRLTAAPVGDRRALLAALFRPGSPAVAGVARGTVAAPVERRSLAGAAVAPPRKPRLVFAIDATASRDRAWEAAKQVTDCIFRAAPGGIEVALAVHSGGKLARFSPFHPHVDNIRDEAAGVACVAGPTRMLDIMEETLRRTGVKALVYIGDCFEEDMERGLAVAERLGLRGIKLVVLHDTTTGGTGSGGAFRMMAARAGGLVLPFDMSSLDRLADALSAVGAYVAGGPDRLRAMRLDSPAARLLLGHEDTSPWQRSN
jgi:hypothetical protein